MGAMMALRQVREGHHTKKKGVRKTFLAVWHFAFLESFWFFATRHSFHSRCSPAEELVIAWSTLLGTR